MAEEVVVTSEEPVASSSSSSLPDHDYNIYQFNKRASTGTNSLSSTVGQNHPTRNQDEQMEAVAQSVAAAAQEKEKLKRKRTSQGVTISILSLLLLLYTVFAISSYYFFSSC